MEKMIMMQVIESLDQMQGAALDLRQKGRLLALVSTSGALHAGHLRLIEEARESADVVVLSVFLNPLEFGHNEDYERYPRKSAHDEAFCREHGVDILFRPAKKDVFPSDYSLFVEENRIGPTLCGVSRPQYFRGVCTWHAQLFNLVRPDFLITGRRDAQKSFVLAKMIRELRYPIQPIEVPVVRAEDQLPENARLEYLNEFQRADAVLINRALQEGASLVERGIRNVDRVVAEVIHHITQSRRLRVIYVSAVDPETMEPVKEIEPGKTLLLAAVWCDEVRLLDSWLIGEPLSLNEANSD